VHLTYLDDSRDEELCVFSALAIPADEWRKCFECVRDLRRNLKKTYGIYVYKELHAWKFVSGRGNIADRLVTKSQRAGIFRQIMQLTASLPGARLFNACFPAKEDERAVERLINRLNRTLEAWDSRAILISDQGKEAVYTRLIRRMQAYNPIPSAYGTWDTGLTYKNLPVTRIIEDPFFKDSSQSYFIQLVDFCAYALLRRERPVPSKTRYGLDQAFALLAPILVCEATRETRRESSDHKRERPQQGPFEQDLHPPL
jgi:Protein of unknown function (DUF3800)